MTWSHEYMYKLSGVAWFNTSLDPFIFDDFHLSVLAIHFYHKIVYVRLMYMYPCLLN